jgi:hypothetical protein
MSSREIASDDFDDILISISSLCSLMESRHHKGHDKYGSIRNYPIDKFVASFEKNVPHLIAAVNARDQLRIDKEIADMFNILGAILVRITDEVPE